MDQTGGKLCDRMPMNCSAMSRVVDRFIALIVGRGKPIHPAVPPCESLMSAVGLADKRDMIRYERALSSAEPHNKAVKKIVPEPRPSAAPYTCQ